MVARKTQKNTKVEKKTEQPSVFTVLINFRDLEDNGHIYRKGSTYPRNGYEPTQERIKELSGKENALKKPIIK